MFTVNIYMNSGFGGGNTRFYFSWDPQQADVSVEPKAGLCLIFRQPPGERYYHDGEEVSSGVKYLFRSDVMYRKRQGVGGQSWDEPPVDEKTYQEPRTEGAEGKKERREVDGGQWLNAAAAKWLKAEGTGKSKQRKGRAAKGERKDGARSRVKSGSLSGCSTFRLNVKNLSRDTIAEELRDMFEPFGTVTDAQVNPQNDGESRGVGFVFFASEEAGRKAMAEMDGNLSGRDGRKISVFVADRSVEDDAIVRAKRKSKTGVACGDLAVQQAASPAQMHQFVANLQAAYMHQVTMWGSPYGNFPRAAMRQHEGTIKSMITKGHGFIECAQTHLLHNCDIYIDRAIVPKGALVGSRVKITVVAILGEHPKAATAYLASHACTCELEAD